MFPAMAHPEACLILTSFSDYNFWDLSRHLLAMPSNLRHVPAPFSPASYWHQAGYCTPILYAAWNPMEKIPVVCL